MEERRVAVVTGASSGIGMATALELAKTGYNLVLAARRKQELNDVAMQCQDHGAVAVPVVTDTTDESAVRNLAKRTISEFGKIDVWINDAAVYLVGKVDDLPLDDMHRVMETNFFGYMHGSQAAIMQFKVQGYGTLINIGSINAAAPQPYVSVYSASKAAIRAFDESLRMELEVEGLADSIRVCTSDAGFN